MDDGSLGHGNADTGSEDKANFAVCSFTEEDCETLRRGLAKFGIGSVYFTAEGYSRLRLNADDAEHVFFVCRPVYSWSAAIQTAGTVSRAWRLATDNRRDIQTTTGNTKGAVSTRRNCL